MVPRESVVAVVVAAPTVASAALALAPLIVALLMVSIRLPVPAFVTEVRPLATLPDLFLVGLSQAWLRSDFAPKMAPHR